jgi:hypothetical protein
MLLSFRVSSIAGTNGVVFLTLEDADMAFAVLFADIPAHEK